VSKKKNWIRFGGRKRMVCERVRPFYASQKKICTTVSKLSEMAPRDWSISGFAAKSCYGENLSVDVALFDIF
jgi:hypothetical protein